MNNANFPYYPEPINEQKPQKESPTDVPKDSMSFTNLLQNLDNLNTNSLISSLLSSGFLGGNNNPIISQALTKILSTKQEKTKKEGSSPSCTFEEL